MLVNLQGRNRKPKNPLPGMQRQVWPSRPIIQTQQQDPPQEPPPSEPDPKGGDGSFRYLN